MKLEKFRKLGKKKITIISSIILVFILMLGIIIYESYALYEEKKSFNVLNGTVPTFGSVPGEIKLAYTINGTSSDKPFPKKTDGYGAQSVTCENGVSASWNDVAWSLEVNNPNNKKQINCTINFIKTKIYGIERALASTSSAWTRTNDASGLVANAQVGTTSVRNDFDAIYPWSDIKTYNYNTTTGEKIWIDQSGFDFNGSKGEVLTYIPEFYYKRYQDGTKEYISISKKQLDGYAKSEAFSVGRYPISGNASGIHSKSGQSPLVNTTIADFRTYAHNLGSGFGIMDWHIFVLHLLYLVEYANYNAQTVLGPGYTKISHTSSVASGGCNNLGMHSGSKDGTDDTSIIYRGVEDFFGNVWQAIDGINIKDRKVYVCYDYAQYASDTFTGCYKAIGYTNGSVDGYISKLGYDANNPLLAFPIEANGTNNTYIANQYDQALGNTIFFINGYFKSNELFRYNLAYPSSASDPRLGARILKIS